jgi:3-dehydroquinate synthase
MNMYKKNYVELGLHRYTVYIGQHLFHLLPRLVHSGRASKQLVIISVPPVSALYLDAVRAVFDHAWQVYHLDVPDGEGSKSTVVLQKIYTWLLENRLERNCTILPLGGGVVGDLAGFAAATYLRGVNLIHLPTSLVAQVDSSIGGKVGINHRLGKNLIGAFYQPRAVVTDLSVLSTLPQEEFLCGVGEVVKYGILNKKLFGYLEKNLNRLLARDEKTLRQVIEQCIRIKAGIVAADEKEQGIRANLNLGHTFGHALERLYRYKNLKHGQAVLLGLYCTLHASRELKQIKADVSQRIKNLLQQIPVALPAGGENFYPAKIVPLLQTDKKIKDGNINLILIKDIGRVVKTPLRDRKILTQSLETLKHLA